ncbi:MAG: DUF92 domain-containing protein [Thermomicrobiales bacterium]
MFFGPPGRGWTFRQDHAGRDARFGSRCHLIGGLAAVSHRNTILRVVTAVAGIFRLIVDSVLGEVIQAKRRSMIDGEIDERTSGSETTIHASGWGWVDNDIVNLACTMSGGLSAIALWYLSTGRARLKLLPSRPGQRVVAHRTDGLERLLEIHHDVVSVLAADRYANQRIFPIRPDERIDVSEGLRHGQQGRARSRAVHIVAVRNGEAQHPRSGRS